MSAAVVTVPVTRRRERAGAKLAAFYAAIAPQPWPIRTAVDIATQRLMPIVAGRLPEKKARTMSAA
jgi:hypothetical protein